MTSFFTLILVIVMAFSSIGGMTANLEDTVSFDAKIGVDAETVMALSGGTPDEEAKTTAKGIGDILDILTLKGTADKESTELALFNGEEVLLSLGVKNKENGAVFASTLLGSNTISVTKALIEQMQQQMLASMSQSTSGVSMPTMISQMQSLDKEQIAKDTEELCERLKAEVEAKYGETEDGEFTVDGLTFVKKTPVNLTYEELTEMLLGAAKELLAKESFQPIIQAAGQGTDINAKIDEALAKLKEQPEEEKPEIRIDIYTDADGCEYTVCDAATKGNAEGTVKAENLHAAGGTVEGKERILITANQFNFELTAEKAEDGAAEVQVKLTGEGIDASVVSRTAADKSSDVTCEMQVQGMPVKSHTVTTVDGERVNYEAEIYMNGGEKPLFSVTGSAGKGGEPVSVYEGEEITEIPFEQLMSTTDTTVANQVQITMMASFMKVITTVAKSLPEDSAAWLNKMIAGMLSPSGTESAPAGND